MDLAKIVSISGKPGLYSLVAKNQNSIIVKNIESGKRLAVGDSYQASVLENIAIYGINEEYPLKEVFKLIYKCEDGKASLSHKSSARELREKLESLLPDYDKERVYDGDVKKIFQWYNLLIKNKILEFTENETPNE